MKDFNFNPFDFLKLLKLSFKPIDDKVGPQDNPPPPDDFLFEQEDKYDVDRFITKYGFPDDPDVMVAKYALPDDNPDIQVEKYALPFDSPEVMKYAIAPDWDPFEPVPMYALPNDDPDVMVAKYALPDEPDVEIVMYALPPDGPQPPIVEPKPIPKEIQPMTTTEFFKLLDPDGKGEIVAEDVIKMYNETTDANLKAILSYFTDGTEVTDAFKLACAGVSYDSYETWNKGITNGTDDPDMIAQNGIISADSLARLAELAKNPSTEAVQKHLDVNRTDETQTAPAKEIIVNKIIKAYTSQVKEDFGADDESTRINEFINNGEITNLAKAGVSAKEMGKILNELFPRLKYSDSLAALVNAPRVNMPTPRLNNPLELIKELYFCYGEDAPLLSEKHIALVKEQSQYEITVDKEIQTTPKTKEDKEYNAFEANKKEIETKANDVNRTLRSSIRKDFLARMRKMLDRLFSEK